MDIQRTPVLNTHPMAFGKGKSRKARKALDTRTVPLPVGGLTRAKRTELSTLRSRCLALLRHFAEAGFEQEPLASSDTDLTQRLLDAQRAFRAHTSLNRAYCDRMRITVQAALANQLRQYFARLLGRIRFVDSEIPQAERKALDGVARRYYYVPPELQDSVTAEDFTSLKSLVVADPEPAFEDVVERLRRILLEGAATGLNTNQVVILREIHRQVQARHRPVEFRASEATVSIALDVNMLPVKDRLIARKLDEQAAVLLQDDANREYRFFVGLANAAPRGERIRVPVVLSGKLLKRLLATGPRAEMGSLTLELGPKGAVAMRLVLSRPKQTAMPLTEAAHVLARDFGYRNTVSLTVRKLDEPLDEDRLAEIRKFTKEEAKKFLGSHVFAGEPDIVERHLVSGRGFIARIEAQAAHIETLTSRIDRAYNELFAEKLKLVDELDLPLVNGEYPRITKEHAPRGHALFARVRTFLALASLIDSLKHARRAAYARVASLKRHWFGFVANLETRLAVQYQALVVREDLTNVAEEKESPTYKGRAFNKLINHGSRGQYARRATEKFLWNGVPEVALPSYYTSTTCYRHANVDKTQRKGDVFHCRCCSSEGRPTEHADAHASDLLSVYPSLVPLSVTNTLLVA